MERDGLSPCSQPPAAEDAGSSGKGACTHTGKTGAGSDSGAGCSVNKWASSHAAGSAELPVRQISVPDWNSTSWAAGRRPAYQFQCNCIGTCTRI